MGVIGEAYLIRGAAGETAQRGLNGASGRVDVGLEGRGVVLRHDGRGFWLFVLELIKS